MMHICIMFIIYHTLCPHYTFPFSGSNGSPGGVIFGMMDSVFTCGKGGNGNTEAWWSGLVAGRWNYVEAYPPVIIEKTIENGP